jgi:CRP/FNR family transcriptional regulator
MYDSDAMTPVDFIKQFPVVAFPKGSMIMSPDVPADSIYAIRTGFAKIYSIDGRGNERLLWIAGRYDIVPTELLFSTRTNVNYFYAALSDISAYKIKKSALLDYAKESPAIMTEIARSMSAHYDDLLVRIQAIEQPTLRSKVIETLCYLGERYSAGDSIQLEEIGLPLTHQDIANLIGATREATAVELKRLKDAGLIDYSRSSFTIHVTRLRAEV